MNEITPDKFIKYFDTKIKEILLNNELYDIETYGWLDHDSVDPKYFGYAMWTLNPRIEFDHDSYWNNKPFSDKPENNDINLMVNGYDFMEIMKVVRLNIGKSLFFKNHTINDLGLSFNYSTLSLLAAIIELNIAADRIRDYYVFTITGHGFKKFKKSDPQKNSAYIAIYEFARDKFKNIISFSENTNEIYEIAIKIKKRRSYRNNLIHDFASNNAIVQRQFLQEQQELFDAQIMNSSFNPQENDYQRNPSMIEDKFEDTKQWYVDLIEIGNLIFQVEYELRTKA